MHLPHLTTVSLTAFAAISASVSLADDWPCYRGPERNGISQEKGWKADWGADGPKTLWKAQVGTGFSSISVAGGKVYTAGWSKDQDTVFCFDAETGKEVWKHSYASDLGAKYYEGGPHATPTVDGGKVYFLSKWGVAFRFDAATGKIDWQKNVQEETGVRIPDWGFAGSVLVHGPHLILNMGECGMALAKDSGKIIWKSGDKNAGYSTPVLAKLGGKEALLVSNGKAYVAVDPASGSKHWEFPWTTAYGVNAADPIAAGDQVFISSGYEKGAALLKIAGTSPSAVWQSKEMRSQMNPCLLIDGYLYGPDGNDGPKASLKCVKWDDGAVQWSHKGFGTGSVIAADGKLIALSAGGELMVAPVSPKEFAPSSRAQVLRGRCWSSPVLASGRIYCRNAAGEMVCLDVK